MPLTRGQRYPLAVRDELLGPRGARPQLGVGRRFAAVYYAKEVIEHVLAWPAWLVGIRHILVPGGRLWLSTPNDGEPWLPALESTVLELIARKSGFSRRPSIRRASRRARSRGLRAAGFENVEAKVTMTLAAASRTSGYRQRSLAGLRSIAVRPMVHRAALDPGSGSGSGSGSTERVGQTPTSRSDRYRHTRGRFLTNPLGVRVLVVDPVSHVRSRLVARLAESGLEVVAEATTSIFARSYARTHSPDAIVIDVELPDRGGLALIGELKTIVPQTFIVVLTNAMAYRRHCLQLGADAFLDKSADFDAVSEILRQVRREPPPGT